MKNLITTVVALSIVALFTYYLSIERANIKYSLSEIIPVSFLNEKSPANIQQLEVKNFGNKEAKKIQIKARGKIVDYKLFPYSKADAFEDFMSENSIEIVYPELPPGGSFKLIIKSLVEGINEEDINISHSSGKGDSALAQEKMIGVESTFGSYWG